MKRAWMSTSCGIGNQNGHMGGRLRRSWHEYSYSINTMYIPSICFLALNMIYFASSVLLPSDYVCSRPRNSRLSFGDDHMPGRPA